MPSKLANSLEETLFALARYFGPLATDYDKNVAKRKIRDLFPTVSREAFLEASDKVLSRIPDDDPMRHEELQYFISELIDNLYHTETAETVTTFMGLGVIAYHPLKQDRPSLFLTSDQIAQLVERLEACPALHPEAKVKIYPQWMLYCSPILVSHESTNAFITAMQAQTMPHPVRFPIPRLEDAEKGLEEHERRLPYSLYPRTLMMTVTTPKTGFVKPEMAPSAWQAWRQSMREPLASLFPNLHFRVEEPYEILASIDHMENEAGFLRLAMMLEHARAMGYVSRLEPLCLTVAFFSTSPKASENFMPELRVALAFSHDPDRPFLGDTMMVGSAFHPASFQDRLKDFAMRYGLKVKFIEEEQPLLGVEEELTFINWSGDAVTLTSPDFLTHNIAAEHIN